MTNNIYAPELEATAYPPSLLTEPNWSKWKLTWNPAKTKCRKTPISISTGEATNEDGCGVSFERAITDLAEHNELLGYRHPQDSSMRLALLDLDNCVSAEGNISDAAQRLLQELNAYAEYSVSGTGIHIICWIERDNGLLDFHKHAPSNTEFYWSNNTIPVTARRVSFADWTSPADIPERTRAYTSIHARLFAARYACQHDAPPAAEATSDLTRAEILHKLFHEPLGDKWMAIYQGDWKSYYASPSDADFNLLMKLGFYSNKDRQLMTAMFSASPLSRNLKRGLDSAGNPQKDWSRPKWSNPIYRDRTLKKVLELIHTTFRKRGTITWKKGGRA